MLSTIATMEVSEMKVHPYYRNYSPNTRFPKYSKPTPVGYFSLDQDRHYIPTLQNLKYFNQNIIHDSKVINFDLNIGYNDRLPKPPQADNERLDHLLHFIKQNITQLRSTNPESKKLLNKDFVCFRGLLRLLMCTPYENREPLNILVMKYNGVIYLCAHETEKKQSEKMNISERNKLLCSYGFKFEQYVLSNSPMSEPKPNDRVLEGEEFCVMYSANLDDNKILFGAEMDGVDTEKEIKSLEDLLQVPFIELKVKKDEEKYHQKQSFVKYKQIKWWCQSFLVGIEDIIVGLRDDKGIVDRFEVVKVNSMPKYAKQFREHWIPSICMQFCSDFLEEVKEITKETDSETDVFQLIFEPSTMQSIKCIRYRGPNKYSFLPSWYIDFLKKETR